MKTCNYSEDYVCPLSPQPCEECHSICQLCRLPMISKEGENPDDHFVYYDGWQAHLECYNKEGATSE